MRAQRLTILVDSENLEIAVRQSIASKASRRSHGAFPDWHKILPELVGGRSLVRLIYFKEAGRRVSKKFEKFWQEELSGEIHRPIKSADPAIIVTAVTLAEKMDCIILISGDKDFIPLIPYLRAKGCKIEVASFDQSAAAGLRKAADRFYRLGKNHIVELKRTASS